MGKVSVWETIQICFFARLFSLEMGVVNLLVMLELWPVCLAVVTLTYLVRQKRKSLLNTKPFHSLQSRNCSRQSLLGAEIFHFAESKHYWELTVHFNHLRNLDFGEIWMNLREGAGVIFAVFQFSILEHQDWGCVKLAFVQPLNSNEAALL